MSHTDNTPVDTYKPERICVRCNIRWAIDDHGRDCPQCGVGAFFTMNVGDIGTAMYFDQTGSRYEDLTPFNPDAKSK